MLENEPTGAATGDATGQETERTESHDTVTTTKPRRAPRKRAASRPAGPPPEETEARPASSKAPLPEATPEATPTAESADAQPRKRRTTRRSTARATESGTDAAGADAAAAESPAADTGTAVETGETAPAAPPRKRRTTRKTKQEPEDAAERPEAESAGEPEPTGELKPAEEPQPAEEPKPARRTRSRKKPEQASAPTLPEPPAAESSAAESSVAVPDVEMSPAEVTPAEPSFVAPVVMFRPPEPIAAPAVTSASPAGETLPAEHRPDTDTDVDTDDTSDADADDEDDEDERGGRRRRRRGGRGRNKKQSSEDTDADEPSAGAGSAGNGNGTKSKSKTKDKSASADKAEANGTGPDTDADEDSSTRRRRRRRRRAGSADADEIAADDPENTVVRIRAPRTERPEDEVQSLRGSTRLEAKKQRRREGREMGRRRPPIITESEFLARREAVERSMIVRRVGDRTQIGVLEDGVLVEHYVDRSTQQSYIGNVYLGKVQNVLPSMEAAFVDIGKGRNAVLYAGEVNFDASGLEGQPKRIESALKSGQSVLVQVTKDPVGHKGARLTSQVSLPGRYLVYVPEGSMTGISRKLPDGERTRLKQILKKIMPEDAGVIVRTAAEGASAEELAADIERLAAQWTQIQRKAKTASAPALLHGEPDMTIRVVRDIFNEDFRELIVADDAWETVEEYVQYVAPGLADRLHRWTDERDVFEAYRIDEQIAKALERKVWLPSGGSLVIDRTEAMTVVDVNTGKFTGQGGNLEETVTKNNLEAAEEIVRQLRLRDVGGIVVIDFIDMVLEGNRDLVLRRLLECLARDRTKHQVAEVTSLGLVQMTRKRVGQGLLEVFSESCDACNGRGIIVSGEPVESKQTKPSPERNGRKRRKNGDGGKTDEQPEQTTDEEREPAAEPAVRTSAANGRTRGRTDAVAADVPPSGDAETETGNGASDKPKRRRTRRAKATAAD